MHTIYIPIIHNSPDIHIDIGHQANQHELDFFNDFKNISGQQRSAVKLSTPLNQIARSHACDMAVFDFFNHINFDGLGPNKRVLNAGIELPSFYGQANESNNIESLAGGYSTSQEAITGLLNSPSHRKHLLGLESPFKEQEQVGIGYCFNPNSRYKYYWVFLSIP